MNFDTIYFEIRNDCIKEFSMKATVKTDVCIGCGLCVDTCPEVFVMDNETNVAKAKVDRVSAELKEKCSEAAKNCPVEAIIVEE